MEPCRAAVRRSWMRGIGANMACLGKLATPSPSYD